MKKTRQSQRSICMVAYTNYETDARVRREAETLAANGFRVRCLCLKSEVVGPYVLDGVLVDPLPVRKYRGKSAAAYLASYLRFLYAATRRSTVLLRADDCDVVHVHNIPDFLVIVGLLPRMCGRKIVLDIHDSVPETFETKFPGSRLAWTLLCLEERLSTWLAHRVICVNHPQRDRLTSRGVDAAKTFISMNVPDPAIFGTPGRPPMESHRLNVVYHGTMAERLGVDLVIRAVAQLQERLPHLRLHLWGDGDDRAAFERLARSLSVSDRVSFLPEGYPLRELPRQLAAMDIGVVGNRRTRAGDLMLPVKLLEYVSRGLPVVAPRLATIQHYFSDDMLAYFDADDVGSLAAALDHLASCPVARANISANAQLFLAQHGWHRQGPELVGLYRTLVEN